MGQLFSSPGSGAERRETSPNYKTYERRLCLLIVCIATLVLGLFGSALYLTSLQEESGPPQIIFSEELNLSVDRSWPGDAATKSYGKYGVAKGLNRILGPISYCI